MPTIVTLDMGGTGATHAAGAREALSVPSMTDMGQSYAQANTARDQANTARDQANTARTQANTAYDQANTARTQANTAYGQANGAYSSANLAYTQANSARSDANTTFATINTTFASTNTIDATQNTWISNLNSAASTINTSLGTINTNYQAAYAQANTARTTANDAYGAANTRLSASGGTLSGDLIITGNLTVSGNQTILNTEVLTTEDAEIILLSNTSSTPALNAGLIVNRGTSTNTFLRWNEALDEWGWSDSGTTTYYFEDLRQGLSTTNTTFATINTTFATLNTSAGTQNTAITTANDQANTARGQANTAYGQANLAYAQANSARSDANTTFATVNTTFATINTTTATMNTATSNRVLKAGDTMTGQLNISSGGLLVTGNVSFNNPVAAVDLINVNNQNIYGINQLRFNDPGPNEGLQWDGGNIWQIYESPNDLVTNSGGNLQFANNGVRRLTLNSSGSIEFTGNVGIGTATPGYILSTSSSAHGQYSQHRQSSGTGVGQEMYYMFNDSSGAAVNYASIYTEIAANTAGAHGGKLGLRTATSGSLTTKILIDSAGNVGIGTTNPSQKLYVAGGSFTVENTNTFTVTPNYAGTTGIPAGILVNSGNAANLAFIADAASGTANRGVSISAFSGSAWFRGLSYMNKSGTPDLVLQQDGGNVGIGTATPQRKLDVTGSGILASFGSQMSVNSIAGIHFGYSETPSNNDNYKKSAMVFERTDNHNQGGNASGKIHFLLHNTGSASASGTNSAVLTLDTDGNGTLGSARVGIGTTSPQNLLHMYGSDAFLRIQAAGGNYSYIRLDDGSTNGYLIKNLSAGTGNGALAGALYTYTDSNKAFQHIHAGTPLFTILSDGNVGIGLTNPGAKLEVSGTEIRVRSANGARFQVFDDSSGNLGFRVRTATGGGWRWQFVDGSNGEYFGVDYTSGNTTIYGTLTELSSISLKENINPITNALETISMLVGVTYDRKDGTAIQRPGLIAEEVEKILPNVVIKDDAGTPSGISYTNLVAYLIESIKELKAEIDVLKSK